MDVNGLFTAFRDFCKQRPQPQIYTLELYHDGSGRVRSKPGGQTLGLPDQAYEVVEFDNLDEGIAKIGELRR